MTRINAGGAAAGGPAGHCRRAVVVRRALAAAVLVGAGLPLLAPAAWAGDAPFRFAASGFELPVMAPGGPAVAPPQDTGVPLYERAPMPNQDAVLPDTEAGPSDPVQPSVIRRASRVGESDGYSRSSSSTSAQESRMKPGLGFALHVPTE